MTPTEALSPFLFDGISPDSEVRVWLTEGPIVEGQTLMLPISLEGPDGRSYRVLRSIGCPFPYREAFECDCDGDRYVALVGDRNRTAGVSTLLITVSPANEKLMRMLALSASEEIAATLRADARFRVVAVEDGRTGAALVFVPADCLEPEKVRSI